MTQGPADNSSLALERLRLLLRGLSPGADARLPTERALAEDLSISRRSVRRALEVLEAEGLVWRRQGSGTFAGPRPVIPPGPTEIAGSPGFDPMAVLEARLRIEPQIAQLAALRACPATVARLERIEARIAATTDSDSRELWDSALHREIARAAGNDVLLAIFDVLDRARHDARWRIIRERARGQAQLTTYLHQHRAICAAIAAHDPVAAGAAMRAHILALQDSLMRQTSLEGLPDVG